ncbi:MAG: tol-pal system protein YbgF [Gemmatimonadota bacterium]|nr:tol-pal system protein YbgF [Gemmatimonadota bacterium]
MRSGLPTPAVAAIALGLALAAGACATRGSVEELNEQNRRILERQDALERRVVSLETTMQRLQEILQGIRADFKADLGAVRRGLNALESAVRGTETRIEQLRRRPPPRPEPADTTAMEGEERGEVDPLALYNAAVTDYQQGRLELARQGFEEYLRRFPDGLSAPDAAYWLGIVSYDQGRYREAIETLRPVPRRWPESAKAPLALRKIGDAWRALGETERARASYRELIDRYPDSSEAEAARRELGG